MEYVRKIQDSLKPHIEKVEAYLTSENPDPVAKGFQHISKLTHVKEIHLVYGLVAFVLFFAILDNAFAILTLVVGTIYPAYCSFKAIESSAKEDDTQWLIYWTVFAFFSLAEIFADVILWWFPFYYVAKLGLLVWCMSPGQQNGSHFIYRRLLKPYLLKNQETIDAGISSASSAATNMGSKAAEEYYKNQ